METAPTMDQDISNVGTRRSLVDICQSLFGKHPKNSYIACNLCKSGIKIVSDGQSSLLIDPIIDHACIHADLKTFQCRCGAYSSRTRSDVQAHIEGFHRLKPRDGDFEDQSEQFHDEISNSIKGCFTDCNGEAPTMAEGPTKAVEPTKAVAPSNAVALKKAVAPEKDEGCGHGSKKEVRNKTRDAVAVSSHRQSKLADQRHSLFNRIIKKSVNSDGKVKCRVCSKEINATRSLAEGGYFKTQTAIQHVEHHLRKPLYRCRLCKEDFDTNSNMGYHLRSKHALGMEKNFEWFADKFHSEILKVFAQCFEKD